VQIFSGHGLSAGSIRGSGAGDQERWAHICWGRAESAVVGGVSHVGTAIQSSGKFRLTDVRQRIRQGQQKEEELVIDPYCLRSWEALEKLGRVETWLKAGAYDNELRPVSYDV